MPQMLIKEPIASFTNTKTSLPLRQQKAVGIPRLDFFLVPKEHVANFA
jgi:hypothetical protein